jgi:hypothetical protein
MLNSQLNLRQRQINIQRLFLILLSLNFFLTSCTNSKIKSCQQISEIYLEINQKTEANLNNKDLEKIKDVAQSFSQASSQLKNLNIKGKDLNQYNQELAEIYQAYADNTLNFLKAFEAKNLEQAIYYKEEVTKNSQKQEEIINNINNYCQ